MIYVCDIIKVKKNQIIRNEINMTDCHTHTSISPDGKDTVLEGARKAVQLNLSAYAVTEHCEANRLYGPAEDCKVKYNDEHYYFNYDIFNKSMEENIKIKEMFSSSLNFINGIELGQATHDFEAAEKIISDQRLDFTIGSMHELPAKEDFAFLDYKKENINCLLSDYFSELFKLCTWGMFDVLGHLTYPLRYIEGENKINIDISCFDEIIAECFKTIASNEKGIEINTSGLRQLYGKTFPDLKYIKMFKECGGKIITIGSDSHCTADIGRGVKDGADLAYAAGFDRIFYFKKHIPYGIRL